MTANNTATKDSNIREVERRTIAAAAFAVYLLRVYPFIVRPQFFCEDGTVFFVDAYNDGWRSLFYPYEGYLVTFQRLTAWLGSFLPAVYAPHFYIAVSLLIPLTTILFLVHNERSKIRLGLFLAVFLLCPFDGTVLANLTNTQWIFGVFLILALASQRSERPSLLEQLFFMLAALTGPFVFFLLPLFLMKAYLERDERSNRLAILAAICAAAHLTVLPALPAARVAGTVNLDDPNWAAAGGMLLSYPIFFFLGPEASHRILLVPLVVGVSTALILFYAAANRGRREAIYFILSGLVVCAASLLAYRNDPNTLLYRPRYALLPTLSFAWAAAELLLTEKFLPAVPIIAALFLSGFGQLVSDPLTDLDWSARSLCIGGNEVCTIPLNWEGRFIDYDPQRPSGFAGRRGRLENVPPGFRDSPD